MMRRIAPFVLLVAAVVVSAFGATTALGASPRWQLSISSAPTNLPPGGEGQIAVAATNIGDGPANGTTNPVSITDKLPPGVAATAVLGFPLTYAGYLTHGGELACTLPSPQILSCTWKGEEGEQKELPLPAFETLEARVAVKISETARTGEASEATITGGDAPAASVTQPLTVSSTPTPFGIEDYKLAPENEDGSPDVQAGSHPFQLTSTIDFAQILESPEGEDKKPTQAALLKDLHVELPPGLIGNVTPFPQCTDLQFDSLLAGNVNLCPAETAVGVASVTLHEPLNQGMATLPVPIFNLTPRAGEPARFGFEALGVPVVLDTAVRTGGDYGVNVNVENISEAAAVLSSRVTFWGAPGDPRHNSSRGWSCLDYFAGEACTAPGQQQPAPLLTLPTSCTGALNTTVTADSWQAPGSFLPPPERTLVQGLENCDLLPFTPEVNVESSSHAADTPTELSVALKVPQEAGETANGLAQADVRSTTVTLPQGLQVNPAAASGLQACSQADVGFQRLEADGQAIFAEGEAKCPDASKLGTVQITTPLLAEPLQGAVYQATQNANPFGSLLALYIVAEAPKAGVRVKLAGKVTPNQATGQLTSTFQQTPQLPFEALDVKFFGGAKAPLATSGCGAYRTETQIEPWSGIPPVSPFSEFTVTQAANGGPCQGPQLFAPSFLAGMTNNQAGAFSPFTLTLSRQDSEQTFGTVATRMPAGLLGMLSRVTLCGEPQANTGSCPAASQIGHVSVQAGVGNEPITLPGAGQPQDPVYLTGSYSGQPFGLSIVVPAVAGPFDLGNVVVRASIHVDPATGQITVTSDPLPSRLQGIPLDVKTVSVAIDKEGFVFNPTNCDAMAVNGTITSTQGASAAVSSRFQAANCATLPFKPKFTVLTDGKTSKRDGAYLHVKVTSGSGQANIAKVKVDLPKQLPSRLTTLQKACAAAVFEANPAACPTASVVGEATAVTAVLRNPLRGPAYLVSHGGAAFPNLEIVLQGEGVKLVLDGNTSIKKGITSSTFKSVPDAPVSTFDLVLPEGPHSVLTTNLPAKAHYSFCGQSLNMPTEITGQNGAVIKQTTKIAVSGCRKAKQRRRSRLPRSRSERLPPGR